MTVEKASDSLLTEVLKKGLSEGTSRETVPLGLVYASVRWGRDYHFGLLSEDEFGTLRSSRVL